MYVYLLTMHEHKIQYNIIIIIIIINSEENKIPRYGIKKSYTNKYNMDNGYFPAYDSLKGITKVKHRIS